MAQQAAFNPEVIGFWTPVARSAPLGKKWRFERYDDAVVHCVIERQARALVAAIGDRMKRVGLRLNRDKTKVVVCCKGDRRPARLRAFRRNVISGQMRRLRLQRLIGSPSPSCCRLA